MTIAAVQQDFCDFLRDAPSALASRVAPRSKHGLAVYHNNFEAQLRDCLGDLYERTWTYLGDEAFYEATVFHREQRPPQGWTLDAYGDGFADSLAQLYPDDPEVPELAWIEWALRRAFSGPDGNAPGLQLDPADDDGPALILHPTVQLRAVVSNAAAIWSGLADGTPPAAARLPGPAAILAWRAGLVPQFRSVMGDEMEMLLRLCAGNSFMAASEAVFGTVEPVTTLSGFATVFERWLGDGVLVEGCDNDCAAL